MGPTQGAVSHDVGTWEQRFCHTVSCAADCLFVQQCVEHPDLWSVTLRPDETGWLIAAIEPLCPWCGRELTPRSSLVRDPDLERPRLKKHDVAIARA